MTGNGNPYDAVIADLKRKRDQIDQTIRNLEAVRGGVSAPNEVQPEGAHEPSGGGEGAFLGMSIPGAVKKLLQARKKALGNAEIVKALEAGGFVLKSENKTNTVGSVLNRRSKQTGDIVSVSRGTWGLKEWYPNRRFDSKKSGDSPKGEESDDLTHDAVMTESNDSSGREQL